jgi:large subunit ribosomal protein L5
MLREEFNQKILPLLKEELGIKNDLRVPRPLKAIVQIGIGKFVTNNPDQKDTIVEEASYILSRITGQKPKIVTAKKSVSGFKLRKGQPVALLVTLRKKRLLDFIERFVSYALPRAKDFKGIYRENLDKKGNINVGLRDATIFPEAISDKIKRQYGFMVNLVGSGRSFNENVALWRLLGFPLKI